MPQNVHNILEYLCNIETSEKLWIAILGKIKEISMDVSCNRFGMGINIS